MRIIEKFRNYEHENWNSSQIFDDDDKNKNRNECFSMLSCLSFKLIRYQSLLSYDINSLSKELESSKKKI